MSPLAAYGLLAHALIFGALTALLPLGILRARAALAATTLALLVGIAPGMHGIFGTPSVTLLGLALLQLAGQNPARTELRPALIALALGSLFYATSWGIGPWDPYGIGYQPWPVLLALVPLALAFWLCRMLTALLILTVDLAAYATGIFHNLWDVLIDPLLLLFIVIRVGWHLGRRFSAQGTR